MGRIDDAMQKNVRCPVMRMCKIADLGKFVCMISFVPVERVGLSDRGLRRTHEGVSGCRESLAPAETRVIRRVGDSEEASFDGGYHVRFLHCRHIPSETSHLRLPYFLP